MNEVMVMEIDNRNTRILLMETLYQYDLYKDQDLSFEPFFEDGHIKERFERILNDLDRIDALIESHLFNYKLYRLSYVDRAIIRLAVFELLENEIPAALIINEAIELTKTYTNLDDEKQHKFNNRVIDAIYKSIKE